MRQEVFACEEFVAKVAVTVIASHKDPGKGTNKAQTGGRTSQWRTAKEDVTTYHLAFWDIAPTNACRAPSVAPAPFAQNPEEQARTSHMTPFGSHR